jgi:MFS family permease
MRVVDDKVETELGGLSPDGSANRAVTCARRVDWLFMTVYGLAYTGLWMALLSPILVGLAMRVRLIDPAHADDGLSLVVGVGALTALFANPFFGRLSDRTTSRYGMRRPWLIGGALGGAAGLLIVAQATSVAQLLLGWCLTQLAYNAQLAALAAMLSDQIPASQRGTVSGIVSISMPLGMICGTFLVQTLAGSALAMFLVPAGMALASALLLACVLHDSRLVPAQRSRYGWRGFLGSFWINPRRFPDFTWTWSSRFLLFAGVAVLLTYQEFYLIHQLHCPPSEVPHRIFLSTLVQSCMVAIFGLLGGAMSDAVGRRKVFVSGAALLYAMGLLLIAVTASYPWFLAGMAITGIAQGTYLAVDLALLNDLLPERETHAARNLGIFNIASVLPQLLMPAIAPAILALSGGSYTGLFVIAAILVALGASTILPVRGVR